MEMYKVNTKYKVEKVEDNHTLHEYGIDQFGGYYCLSSSKSKIHYYLDEKDAKRFALSSIDDDIKSKRRYIEKLVELREQVEKN